MTTSPERCLGSLIKDLDEEICPNEIDFESKDETTCRTSSELKLSLDSIYSYNSNSSFFSPLSGDNKFSPTNNYSNLSYTKSSILSAFTNQRTTIILQKSLMEISKDTIDLIIKEMSGTFSENIKNKNGNYFCSDLFKVCDKNQRIIILEELKNTLSDDCIDEYGTHPIQNLVELASSEEEYKLILFSFQDYNKILNASLNPNGSYVIQKIIVHIPEQLRLDFNSILIKYLSVLAMDMYGVCTVKKFIGYTKNELHKKQILNIILTNFISISENQYGNYLIQYILEHWWDSSEGIFLKKICISKFHILAVNHFSSYICDLFIKLSSVEDKEILMSSLIKNNTIALLNNNHGNFIKNKLMNSLKFQKEGNNSKKAYIPLSLNNIRAFHSKNRKETEQSKQK
jgi:hypothetical protein